MDTQKLTELYRRLVHEALRNAPGEVKLFRIIARDAGDDLQVELQSNPQFELNDESIEALREIFLLCLESGQNVTELRADAVRQADDSWKMNVDYDHA